MGEIPQNQEEPRKIEEKEILKEKGIVSFDVELTPEERNIIQEIEIKEELPQFNYYGPVNEELTQ